MNTNKHGFGRTPVSAVIRIFGRVLIVFALVFPLGLVQASGAAYSAPQGFMLVNTTADEYGTGTACSLREAIKVANSGASFGGCSYSTGIQYISLPAGTYNLTGGANENNNSTGDLDILDDVFIVGNSNGGTIIDGNYSDRIFHIHDGTVFLQYLTIQNGRAPNGATGSTGATGGAGAHGGGIYIESGTSTTLQDLSIKYNGAGTGGMGGSGSTGTPGSAGGGTGGNGGTGGMGGTGGYGGGVYNAGSLTINDSVIEWNNAGSGGFGGYGGDGGDGGVGIPGASTRDGGLGGNGGVGGRGGSGGNGGGIYNASTGNITIRRSEINSNGSGQPGVGRQGGDGGDGGAGAAQSGTEEPEELAGDGGNGGEGNTGGIGGSGGEGGGIYHTYGGSLNIYKSKINNNAARSAGDGGLGGTGGWGGTGGASPQYYQTGCEAGYAGYGNEGGNGGRGGSGGTGGGLYVSGTTLIEDTEISNNFVGAGGSGGTGGTGGDSGQPGTAVSGCVPGNDGINGHGGNGGHGYLGGLGGAVYVSGPGFLAAEQPAAVAAMLTINRSAIHNNYTFPGGDGGDGGTSGWNVDGSQGYGGYGGNGSKAGNGAGLYIVTSAELNNTTISENHADAWGGLWGDGGDGLNGDGSEGSISGYPSYGGGAYVDANGSLKMRNVTVVYNTAEGKSPPDFNDGKGGGLYAEESDLINVGHTIIAQNTAYYNANCKNSLYSAGYNMTDNYSGCTYTSTGTNIGNRSSYDYELGLGPLQDNGGYAPSVAIDLSSEALDNGFVMCADGQGVTLTTDQRGAKRPADGNADQTSKCDIGAYELQPLLFLPLIID